MRLMRMYFSIVGYVHAEYGNIYIYIRVGVFFISGQLIDWCIYSSSAVLLRWEDKMENVCVERTSRVPLSAGEEGLWYGRVLRSTSIRGARTKSIYQAV